MRVFAIAAAALALTYAVPSRAEPTPTPPAATYPAPSSDVYYAEHRPNRTLLWTGVTFFAVTYTGSAVAGAMAGDRVEDKNLFIPLVGPWLDLGQRNCEFRRCDDGQERIWKSLIIGSGVVQGVGVLLALSSFFVAETRVTKRVGSKPKPELHLAPVSYVGGAGAVAGGSF